MIHKPDINKPVEKDEKIEVKQETVRRGRPQKKTTLDEMQARYEAEDKEEVNGGSEVNGYSDGEVSFNTESISPETEDQIPTKKRKRIEPVTKETPKGDSSWRGGEFQCLLCEKSFKTPTFLLQHYVSPHFKSELKSEFADALAKKKCPTCRA